MWFNPIMTWLLKSPLHGFVSKNMLLISYTGRRSGKSYTTPVNYVRMHDEQGEYLATTSFRSRTWWRNLRGGQEVVVRLQGKDYPASAQAIEQPQAVAERLGAFFQAAPEYVRYFNVHLSPNGQPLPDALATAAQGRVFIITRLARNASA